MIGQQVERPEVGALAVWRWGSPRLLFGLACALFLLGQGWWLAHNETIAGRDAGAHLVRSIEMYAALGTPGPEMLSALLGVSVYRPPLFYLLTLPFYLLFGLHYDAALLPNLLWLLLTAVVIYALGRRLGGEWVGAISGILTLATPILFALIRLYYQEPLVTFLVWLGVLFLLQTERGANRRASVLFGLVVGLGLLAKWTTPAFLVGPLAVVLWSERHAWKMGRVGGLRVRWQFLVIALVLAVGWAGLMAPLTDGWDTLALLGLGWATLFGGVAILAASPSTRATNLLLAGAIALAVASLWYLPNLSLAGRLTDVALGEENEATAAGIFSLLSPDSWLFYLRALAWEQMGVVLTGAFGLGLIGLRGRWKEDGVRMLLVMVGLTWLVFTLTPFRMHTRAIVPVLPGVVLLAVVGLPTFWARWVQPRGVPLGVGMVALGTVVGWQLFQFWLLTTPTALAMSGPLQQAGLVVSGSYFYWPAQGATDPAYHVAPGVWEILGADRGADGRVSLGMLVNETQLHQNTLRAEFEMWAPGAVRVIPLTKDEAPYRRLFTLPYLLYKVGGPPTDAEPAALATLERLAHETEANGLFPAAFDPVQTWETPAGETLILARRRHALVPDSVRETYAPLMAQLETMLTPDDLGVIEAEAQVNPLGALGWPDTPVVVLDAAHSVSGLEARFRPGQRVFAILWNQSSETEPWLNSRLVRSDDWWFGDTHVIAYVVPTETRGLQLAVGGRLAGLTLQSLVTDQPALVPGGALTLALRWQVDSPQPDGQRTVIQLYDATGTLVSMRDLPPEGAWAGGSEVVQRTALLLPRTGWQGPVCMVIARYDQATGARLLTPDGQDHLSVCAWS